MMDWLPETIKNLIIPIVVLLVVGTVFIYAGPLTSTQEVLPQLTENPITIVYENIPCMINCLTNLQGDELAALSSQSFTNIDASPSLINWFPCNNDIMKIAMLINEMSRWNWDNPNQELVTNSNAGYNDMKQLLYTCITAPLNDYKCTHHRMNFLNFCSKSDYLWGYGYVPCTNTNSFIDYLDKNSMGFANREGRDIENDFICDPRIGDYYNPPYALCTTEGKSKYDEQNCLPSWQVLINQERKKDGVREISYARCEDFALLYYSLFRSISVPAKDMEMELGYCDLPCNFKKYIQENNWTYRMETCYVPASLKIKNLGTINACQGIQGTPDSYQGTYLIMAENKTHAFNWLVTSSIGTRKLSPDGNYSNDVRIIGGLTSGNEITPSGYVEYDKPINTNIAHYISSQLYNNELAKYGFTIEISDLKECINDLVIVRLGFTGGTYTDYTINEGETRSVMHKGKVTGDPYFKFMNSNQTCKVSYNLIYGMTGLIFEDPCFKYAGIPSTQGITIIEGVFYNKSDYGNFFPSTSFNDYIK